MTYQYLKNIKKYNQTLKLLNSDNFAMMVSFFYFVFVEKKSVVLNHTAILNYLDDFLFEINQSYEGEFPKSAKEYLDDFSNDKNGYLRKYHGNDDEPLYELTPYTQKALEFVEGLEKSEFVGSRSKFTIIFELLEELEFEIDLDDNDRILVLEKQKADIDKQIKNIKSKKDLRFDSSRIKEHFMLIDEQARKLKYDFSQIEYNFRDLNQEAMEKIASSNEGKDVVLGSIFEIEDNIRDSDQGKSFFAFWQLLTDAKNSQKLSDMLENLYKNETIKDFDNDMKLKDLKYDLIKNADKISKVSAKLISQLRRFIDDRVWLENKRILELCKSIQKNAINVKKDMPSKKDFMLLDGSKVYIDSVFEKDLYTIKEQKEFNQELNEVEKEINIDSFYDIFYVDEAKLRQNITQLLQHQAQCTIEDIVEKFGITKGISELIGYLSIAKNSNSAMVDENDIKKIKIKDSDGLTKNITMPKIIFVKGQL